MIDRTDKNYKRKKLAYQLVASEAWRELLLPELEAQAGRRLPQITTMDMAFSASTELGKQHYANHLIAMVMRLCDDFTNTGDG